jgi:preprotein translocase subunit SecA
LIHLNNVKQQHLHVRKYVVNYEKIMESQRDKIVYGCQHVL